MGALRRTRARRRQLSWKTDCSGEFARAGVHWLRRESVLWPHILAESTGAERARDRLRKGNRSQMATRALGRNLHLPRCAAGHGRRSWLELSAALHHSIDECANRSPGNEREVLGCFFSASNPRPIASLTDRKSVV